MKKPGFGQNSGKSRSPPNYSKKYELVQPAFLKKSPGGHHNSSLGYSSMRNHKEDYCVGDKENYSIMKKGKYLKEKYQNGMNDKNSSRMAMNRISRDNSKSGNNSVQSFVIFGQKNSSHKNMKVEKRQTSNDSKKCAKVTKIYGKSKSPSEMGHKYMSLGGSNLFNHRQSPKNRSPLANLNNSSRFFPSKPANTSPKQLYSIAHPGHRSRHQHPLKYSTSLNQNLRQSKHKSKSKKTSNPKHKKASRSPPQHLSSMLSNLDTNLGTRAPNKFFTKHKAKNTSKHSSMNNR